MKLTSQFRRFLARTFRPVPKHPHTQKRSGIRTKEKLEQNPQQKNVHRTAMLFYCTLFDKIVLA